MSPLHELATLTTLAQALSRPSSLGDSLDTALATVARVLGLETGWVWLVDDDDADPQLAAARALPAYLRDHPAAMRGDCYCLKTFRAGHLSGAANVNVVRCSRLAQVIDDIGAEGVDLRCHASVPLAVGDQRLGMLNVASRDWRVLTDDELNLLTTIGALVSLVIQRSRLETVGARAIAAEERNRIAREIHDTLAQGLAAVTMRLEAAEVLAAGSKNDTLQEAVSGSLVLARNTLDEARRSVLDLRASPLEGRTLPQALEDLAADTRNAGRSTLDVRLFTEGFIEADAHVPIAVEVGLYRIAQQAVANVLRHARAESVALRLSRTAERIELRVEDDGTGFEPVAVAPDRFGLVGMGERARLLGGMLIIETTPGVGTAVSVEVPLRTRAPIEGRSDA